MRVLMLLFLVSCATTPSTWRQLSRECHNFYLDKGLSADAAMRICTRELKAGRK
jgi:hypothetical protein